MFNEVLEGRYPIMLAKLLSMKGGSPTPQLSGDLTAGFALESDRPEWYALMGGRLCTGQAVSAAGGAGNRTQVGIVNPTSSGVIMIIEEIRAASSTAVFGFVVRGGATLTTVSGTVGVRDRRIAQTPAATIVSKNNAAVTGGLLTIFYPDFSAAAIYAGRLETPWILGPGNNIAVDPGSDNQDLQCTFIWRERAANPAELALGA